MAPESVAEEERVAVSKAALINGVPAALATAVPVGPTGNAICTAVLIARRTLLTAGHCFRTVVTRCDDRANVVSAVRFPLPDGSIDLTTPDPRRVDVINAVWHDETAPDLRACPEVNCQVNALDCTDILAPPGTCPAIPGPPGTPQPAVNTPQPVDRSRDLMVLYLGAEAPADIQPLQVMVDPSVVSQSPRFVSFATIANWGTTNNPFVTIAGSGFGTQTYGPNNFPGRDVGITQWISAQSVFTNNWDGCTGPTGSSLTNALLVMAPDLVIDAGVFPDGVGRQPGVGNYDYPNPPGANFTAAAGGDSGGPVLVGNDGSVYRGQQASALPPPAAGDNYVLNTRYVAGIAEFNRIDNIPTVTGNPSVASDTYAQTFELSNSQFIASALVDNDNDGIPNPADPFPNCSTQKPVFLTVPPAITVTDCSNPSIGTPTVAPNPDCGAVTITPSTTTFPLGTTVVTWTATNAAGNSETATTIVTAVFGDDASCCPAGTNVITGNGFGNVLFGTSGADCILGLGGNDDIFGLGGNDFISGGSGNDDLEGDDGADHMTGGIGIDTLDGDSGDDFLNGGDGADYLDGEIGHDVCEGGAGNDHLDGDDGDDFLIGGTGDDFLEGDSGEDTLFGNEGNDDLFGGLDDDTLDGGPQFDDCVGGLGNDTEVACE